MGFFMKKVTVNKLEPGMVTAEQILTKNGQMIVDKGVTLTRPLIMRLSFYCVLSKITLHLPTFKYVPYLINKASNNTISITRYVQT